MKEGEGSPVQQPQLNARSTTNQSTKSSSLLNSKLAPRTHWSRANPVPINPPSTASKETSGLARLRRESSLKRVSSLPLHFDQKPIKDLEIAKTIIEDAIGTAFDCNNHSIDISNSGLTVVPSSIFDLKCFTPVNTQRDFCLLHLYLNNNFLTFLPDELFDLEKIGSNQLEEVSSDIYKLTNLEELSLAGNRLRCLPAEIVTLPKLKSLSVNQNPFMTDEEIESFNNSSTRHLLDLKEICIRILAVHNPLFLKQRGIQINRCSNCHKWIGTPFFTFIKKQSICDSKPIPVIYKSCSLECYKSLSVVE